MDHRCFLEGYYLQLLQYILLYNVHCHKISLYQPHSLFHKLLNFAAVWNGVIGTGAENVIF